jgi:hypothetical protein
MLDAVVKSLGTVLEPEDLERARGAYALAITHIDLNETEFAHVQRRRLRTRLAHLVIRLARDRAGDCQALSDEAVSALRAPIPLPAAGLSR